MLLVLDNYDSFTYNLVQYLCELGADIEVFRNDEIDVAQLRKLSPQAIVLSPGPGRPENAGNMNEIIREFAQDLPILGVCLGHQAIAQVHGGRITYAPTLMHGKTSEISHDGSTLFKSIESPFTATRYHSLTVERASIPDTFNVTAWTGEVVMGIEHKTLPLFGLQFHPESILTVAGKRILSNFIGVLK